MPRVLFGVTVAMTAEAFLRSQMQEMADRGWDVHLACAPDDGTDSWVRLQDLSHITLHPIHMRRQASPLRDISSLRAWRNLISLTQPDLVVASTPKAGLLAGLAARLEKVPNRLYHVRGLRFEGLRGLAGMFMCGVEGLSVKVATHVVLDSASLSIELDRHRLDPAGKGVVLGQGSCCGVDTQHYRPPTNLERYESRQSLSIEEHEFAVGFIGRITRDKGVTELLAAFEALSRKYPQAHLILGGPIEDSSILDSLDSDKTQKKVTFTGTLDDVRSVLWALDLFVLPSYREGFPVANLEAQACGVPVVTTTATGCRDSIAPGKTGTLIPPRDPQALMLAMQHVIESRQTLEGWRLNCRSLIEENFDTRIVNERFVNYLESIVASS